MRNLADAIYRVSLTAWVGGLWVIGYLVAPALFNGLGNRQLAGVMAGKLFALIAWVGFACGAYLLVFLVARWGGAVVKRSLFWLVLAMLALTVAGHFGIQPLMVQLKADALPRDVMESVFRDRFVAWHGISSIVYLLESLLGLWLVVWGERGLR